MLMLIIENMPCWMVSVDAEGENLFVFSLTAQKYGGRGGILAAGRPRRLGSGPQAPGPELLGVWGPSS